METVTKMSAFSDGESFELAQRMGKAMAASGLIPTIYQNNLPNTLIAMELAQRIGASPLMVMQNLYVVHGKPSFSSTFLIAAINQSGRFSPLRFRVDGTGDQLGCIAWAKDSEGEVLEGPRVSIEMAKKEGWFNRNGSKWQTMPELMLRYRAATFFSRLYCPEITMGMHSREEVEDITYEEVTPIVETVKATRITQQPEPVKAPDPEKHDPEPTPEPEPKPRKSREWVKPGTPATETSEDVHELFNNTTEK